MAFNPFAPRAADLQALPRWGRVYLRPTLQLTRRDWRRLHGYFRDRELADWNGAAPIRMPEWIFRKVMQDEERLGERYGFGILNEHGVLIGSVELYDMRPLRPASPHTATLGVMIGERQQWGNGYGREAVQAALHWAFTQLTPPLRRVRLTTFSHNHRAQRSFAACGFVEVGRYDTPERTEVNMEVSAETWRERFLDIEGLGMRDEGKGRHHG